MHVIRILQISDILAGSLGVNAGKIFEELTSWVDENSPGDRLDVVDYIVVCGNVTADGTPRSFGMAHELLCKLGEKLLVKDSLPNERWKEQTRLSRMVVVPGRTDVPIRNNEPDFQPFKDFHDQLFAAELNGRVSSFELGSAIYRPLKDITLIGGTYWDVTNRKLRETLLQVFEKEIRGVEEDLSQFEYLKYSPKILISASYPLYDWDVRDIYRRIRRFLRDHLKVSLHLFGSGSIVGVLPEPYSLPHIGLGTGPRSPKGFWPFRANLIEMCVRTDEDSSRSRPLISNYVFQRLPEDDRFVRRDHIKGQLDPFLTLRQEAPSQKTVFDSFIEKIGQAIFNEEKRFVLISGLPGSGKSDLFKLLQKQTHLAGNEVQVVDIVIENYDLKTFEGRLASAERKIIGEPQPTDNRDVIKLQGPDAILVVRDLYYHDVGNRKSQVAEFLNQETLSNLFMFDNQERSRIKAIVYLVSAPDLSLEPLIPPFTMEKLVLPPLAKDAIKLLVKQYSRDTPVVIFQLDNVTGGYAGFSKLVLDATKEAFDYVAGAEPISSVTSARLMEQALDSSQKLRTEAQLYLQAIESQYGGAAISQYIQNEFRKIKKGAEKKGQNAGHGLQPPDVSVSVRKLKRTITSPTERQSVETTLDQFVNMGVLEKDRQNADLYKVRVVVPFLIGSKHEQRLPVSENDSPFPKLVPPIDQTLRVDFLIVTALEEERDAVLKLLDGAQKLDPIGNDIYTYHSVKVAARTEQGTVGSYNAIVMSYFGMGRLRAGTVTANAIHRWRPACVLLVGIAGGVAKRGVKLGDILIAKQIVDYSIQKLKEDKDEARVEVYQLDEQLRFAAESLPRADYENLLPERPDEGIPEVHYGDIASGDKVDARGEIVSKFGEEWPRLIGIEMEAAGAAVATLHAAYRPRFFMVRAVSDLADREKDSPQVGKWREYACNVAAAFAVALLRSGPLAFTANGEIDAPKAANNIQNRTEAVPITERADRIYDNAIELTRRNEDDVLTSHDVSSLAKLLDRSGKAEFESRGTLCININLDPHELYFLRIQKDIDFATQLVAWLQRTGNTRSLLGLCEILAKVLQGDYLVELSEIREKLRESVGES
jgi:nucleoside phosphorylase/energy-coupling factor transporter ATP-binding protein EcfA2